MIWQILVSFGPFVSQAWLGDHVLSFFIPVDRVWWRWKEQWVCEGGEVRRVQKDSHCFLCLLRVMTLLITYNIRPCYMFCVVLFTRCTCLNRGVNVFLPRAGGLTSKKPALLSPWNVRLDWYNVKPSPPPTPWCSAQTQIQLKARPSVFIFQGKERLQN